MAPTAPRTPRPRPPIDYAALAPRVPEEGLDLFEVFGKDTEIEMEIGFGRGLFLVQRARAEPTLSLLGLEIKRKWAYRVAERCKRLGLERVRALAADVRLALPVIGPDASLQRVYLHFPDPWWKKRHGKRRVLDTALLDQLQRLLRSGGELFVQTDVDERAAEYIELLKAHPAFELAAPGGYLDHNPFGAVSNRERRADQDGLPVYRILARRA